MINIQTRNNINIRGKNISVIGLGKSGTSAAQLAHHKGGIVFTSDPGTTNEVQRNVITLESYGIDCECGEHSERIYNADLWIVSPGVPKDAEIIVEAKNQNIPIVSEIEFASWFTDAPVIAVTGSNGKTTTVHALKQMCQTQDIHPALAGNMGVPFSEMILNDLKSRDTKRIYILEISSFQMEFIHHFKPSISVFLNISPDHLDRYLTMDDYVNAKMAMMTNQTKDDTLIYFGDDPILVEKISASPAKKIAYTLNADSTAPFQVENDKILNEEHATLIRTDEVSLPGLHNLTNLLAAATAAHFAGISDDNISEVMRNYSGVPHRLECVSSISGVQYVNDSKATNIDAVCVAMESYTEPLILILGGKFKGGDFKDLLPHANNLKKVIAYGQARNIVAAALGDAVSLSKTERLKDAVAMSHTLAQPGDVVLLSPGCSSFDQFSSFEDRGNQFKYWVRQLDVKYEHTNPQKNCGQAH